MTAVASVRSVNSHEFGSHVATREKGGWRGRRAFAGDSIKKRGTMGKAGFESFDVEESTLTGDGA